MNTTNRFRATGFHWTLFALVLVLIYLFPVYWMIATSLKTSAALFANPPQIVPSPLVFTAYQGAILNNPATLRAIFNSTVISSGAMTMTLILAVPAAYALARLRLWGSTAMTLLLLVAQMLPAMVIATPLFLLFSWLHLLNSYAGLVLANTTFTLPFAIIVLRPFFLSVPAELEAAAQIDGCTQWGAFWQVILPLVQPGIITVGVFAFLMAWGEFPFALALTTNDHVQPVTVVLNTFIGQYGTQWEKLMAVATTIALPIIAVFTLLQRYIVSGLLAGSVKE